LDLSNNHIKTFIPEIGELTTLEELLLTGNPIGEIPPTVSSLRNMEILDLSSCELTSLPEEFTFQTRVIELNLATNHLEQLPATIGRMTRLATLNVAYNQLRDLPMTIGFCLSITLLNIQGNPIKSQEMLYKFSLGTDQLIDYLEKRLISYKIKSGADLDSALFGKTDLFAEKKQPRYEEVAAAPELSTEQKLSAIKVEARGIIQDLLLHLGDMRRQMLQTTELSQAVKFAIIMRKLKPDIDVARAAIPPQPAPQLPIIHPGEDKLIALQKTINGAIRETEVVLVGLQKSMGQATQVPAVINLVKLLKPIKAGLGK